MRDTMPPPTPPKHQGPGASGELPVPRAFAKAFAKINLTLDVLGKREDGYHDLASIMQTIALHDTLLFEPNHNGHLVLSCDLPELNSPDNLVLKAAEKLKREVSRAELGASIEVHKEIPVQGGLGGGSSDAACALVLLNQLWDLGVPEVRLLELASELGSDIPFFVYGGTAEIGGRGEYVTRLPPAEPVWLVLARPAIGVPTPLVFANFPPDSYSTGAGTAQVARAVREHQPLPLEQLSNDLEPTVVRMFPEVGRVRDWLQEAGAPLVYMSGSGPSLFAPFRRLQEASAVLHLARTAYPAVPPTGDPPPQIWLTHTI